MYVKYTAGLVKHIFGGWRVQVRIFHLRLSPITVQTLFHFRNTAMLLHIYLFHLVPK